MVHRLALFDQVLVRLGKGFRLVGCNRRASIHRSLRFPGLRIIADRQILEKALENHRSNYGCY
jgi:hypothetical protein